MAMEIRVQKSCAGAPMALPHTLLSRWKGGRRTLGAWGRSGGGDRVANLRRGGLAGTAHDRFDGVAGQSAVRSFVATGQKATNQGSLERPSKVASAATNGERFGGLTTKISRIEKRELGGSGQDGGGGAREVSVCVVIPLLQTMHSHTE